MIRFVTQPDDDGFNPFGSGPVPIGPRKGAS
jgi:hypothetical protein